MTESAPSAIAHKWHDETAGPRPLGAEARRSVRQRRIYALLLGILGLFGAFAGMLSWYRPAPDPYFVPLWITQYRSPLIPVNFQADHDREAIRAGAFFAQYSANAFASQERHLLVKELAALQRRQSGDSIVVYLCAFACTSEKGVQVFPADLNPNDPLGRLSLRDVLRELHACPSRNRLLILDIMRPSADPRLGILLNDVATRVPEDMRAVEEELRAQGKSPRPLHVLCACSPGQVSLGAEDLERSLFGYYLEQGLRGWADGIYKDQRRDAIVSVEELAGFLKARVDRWALRNRLTRQTPVLYGAAENFPLIALEQARPRSLQPLPAIEDYPAWLRAGWKLHDQWRADDTARLAPRTAIRLEAHLLRAEKEWRSGSDPERIETELKDRIGRLQDQVKKIETVIPQVDPPSLALGITLGRKPDPAVAAAFKDLLQQLAEQPHDLKPEEAAKAEDKLVLAFQGRVKEKPYLDVAYAVFETAVADENPRPERLRLLTRLLRGHSATRSPYVETVFLERLAELADQFGSQDWPTATARLAIQAVQKGEVATSRPRSFLWVEHLLEEAAQNRHDGEVLLWARGYAPLDHAHQLLKQANDGYDVILAHENTIDRALRTLHRAYAFLPSFVPTIEIYPRSEGRWQTAIQVTDELMGLLVAPADFPRLSPTGLGERMADIRQRTEVLGSLLDDLLQPFSPENLTLLLAQARGPKPQLITLQEIQALLATPYLKADDRATLWKAGRELARHFHESTLEVDHQEDRRGMPSLELPRFALDQDRFEREELDRAALRARVSVRLLGLAGLAKPRIDELEAAQRQATQDPSKPDRWYALATALQRAWNEHLPAQYLQSQGLVPRYRISYVYPPFDPLPALDDTARPPSIELLVQEATALWRWLASRYRYASHDPYSPGVYADPTRTPARREHLPVDTFIEMGAVPQSLALSRATPTATCTVKVNLYIPSGQKPRVGAGIVTADPDWLRVIPDLTALNDLAQPDHQARSCTIPLLVQLKPGADLTGTVPPRGFLFWVRIDGRTFHHRVPVNLTGGGGQVLVFLSPNATEPTPTVDELHLRPVKVQQPYYLWVTNATPKPRNVFIEVKAGDSVIRGPAAKLPLAVNETRLVNLGGPAPKPGSELPTLTGALQVRVLDADTPGADLAVKKFPVRIALPEDYIRITDVQFDPASPAAGGLNRLMVRLRAVPPLTPPPCFVDLVLPPQRIPGFLGVKAGTFRGELPADGRDLTLFAANLQLAEGSDEAGYAYLTVDGSERAVRFRTTFARRGDPTSPREDNQPDLRLRADRAAPANPKYLVTVEVDSPPEGATLDLSLGHLQDGSFVPDLTRAFPQARNRRVGFSPLSADGAFLFEASLQDWGVPLDVTGVVGQRLLRARLLDAQGSVIKVVTQEVILDDSPPDKVRFLDVPTRARRDVPLTLRAAGVDPQSGIREVAFFVGKPLDGKAPPTALLTPGQPLDTGKSLWSVQLPLPQDRSGPTDLTVQFVNGVGLSSFATTLVDIFDPNAPKPPEKPAPGRIQGTVVEGDRPQPGLDVVLADEKGTEKARTKTRDNGTFAFEDQAPGKYKVTSLKITSNRKAEKAVEVKPGATVMVQLDLYVPSTP